MKNILNIKKFVLLSAKQKREYRKSSKYDLILTNELEEIIIGLLLGDLYAEKNKEKSNTRLQFKQSIKNKEYIDHLYLLFEKYCSTAPKINVSKDKRPAASLERNQMSQLNFEL